MKKILITLSLVVFTVAAASAGTLWIDADQTQTGWVNNYGYVNVYADGTPFNPYYVGLSAYTDYRSIYTFDTSDVPANADINYVLLHVSFSIAGDDYEYIFDNTAIDFAGTSGFGGSFTVTSLDYSALAAASFETVIANAAIGGLMLNLDSDQNPRDLNDYINRSGKTQIRLRMFQNPDSLLATYTGVYDTNTYTYKTRLLIGWE